MSQQHLSELHQKIDTGIKKAIADAIEKHRRLGQSISICQQGKIITLTADQIPPKPSQITLTPAPKTPH